MAVAIAEDIRRAGSIVVPAHFEADAYAGLRRMVNRGTVKREDLPVAIRLLTHMTGERVPLAALLGQAYELFDRVGAHDVFYVVAAREWDCALLTVDGPLARAADSLGVRVLYHDAQK